MSTNTDMLSLQSQLDQLTQQNRNMLDQIRNLVSDHARLNFFMCTKSQRLSSTNFLTREIMKDLNKFNIIKEIKKNEKLSLDGLQKSLDDLFTYWATSTTPDNFRHDFVNYNPIPEADKARPIFQLKNFKSILTKTSPYAIQRDIHKLIYKVDFTMWVDLNSFTYVRPNAQRFPTQWESYVAAVLTVYIWNHFKPAPVRYVESEISVDYDCPDSYALTMLGNMMDLRDTPVPEWNLHGDSDKEEQIMINPKRKRDKN